MAIVPKTYSDGPSDEMNAQMEQDLQNFHLPVVVSPEQSGYLDDTPVRGTTIISPPTPPRAQQQRARSTERRSSSSRPPRGAADASPLTPPRSRASSAQSRRGLELKEREPPPNAAQRRRPRSSSSKRRSASTGSRRRGAAWNDDEDSASYDGSYASNGSEVIDDLNTLSDFLRERRQAKRAQRQENLQQAQVGTPRRSRSRR